MIRAIAYDPERRQLRVRFVNGGLYRYLEVPPQVAAELVDPPSGSPGRYFNEHIRDGFDFEDESG